jgi:biopolymer transport protein TolQ
MQLVLHASLPVKLVIIVLVAFSLVCWVVIFAKALHIARARNDSARFK